MAAINLATDPVFKLFSYYFFPAFFGLFVLSTDVFFDGLFVGHGVGAIGLAAVNMCVPVFYIFMSLELLFSFGGAVMVSIALGRGDEAQARRIFSSVTSFMFIFSSILGLALYFSLEWLLGVLGASGELFTFAREYLSVIVLATPIMMMHPVLEAFVRNDRAPYLAMSSMVVGSLCNIVLNYTFIFVFSLGLFGAALATVIGHSIGIAILLSHFIFRRGSLHFENLKITPHIILNAFKNGLSPAFTEASAGIVIALFNLNILEIAGGEGVAVFGAVSYVGFMAITALIATSQGMQPIVSFNHGAQNYARVREVFSFSLKVALALGVGIYTLSYIFSPQLSTLFFPNDSKLAGDSVEAMRIYYTGYLFLGANILSAVFFQSIERPKPSFLISIFYNFIFVVAWLMIMPEFFGLVGVWLSYPLAMASGFLLAVGVIIYIGRNKL
ncbi:MAG: MATE family efflux transporter [Wolinella sp.]